MAIDPGKKAPSFSLAGDDGKTHKLSDYAGKRLVLYFYPKDDTPGCTTEACDFRDNVGRITKRGAAVLGVSKDSLASHGKFRDKYKLNFPLLSDADLAVHKKYEAWGDKTLYGKKSQGVIRSTFLIDENGKVAKAWRNVRTKGHVDQVLEALAELDG
jgi:peroxiredoxin Q/BCP